MANPGANRRISDDLEDLAKDPVEGISVMPDPTNNRRFLATIVGPQESPYEGGIFQLELTLPEEYPYAPPKVRFVTKIYHPNISSHGSVGMDTLGEAWSAALTIQTVLLSVQSLLAEPNPHDSYNHEAAHQWKTDKEEAERIAREWTCNYATTDN